MLTVSEWRLLLGACTLILSLAACGPLGGGRSDGPVTLYRNSSTGPTLRIHFATFDSDDGVNYNLSNCQMAARLLNANIRELNATADDWVQPIGFWCEVGSFDESGTIPLTFEAQYPTDAR